MKPSRNAAAHRCWFRRLTGAAAVAMIFAATVPCALSAGKNGGKPTEPPASKKAKGTRPPATEDLYESPNAPTVAPSGGTLVPPVNQVEAPLSKGPVYADAWPSEYRPAAQDLALPKKEEMRADAFAAFVEGQMADLNGDPLKALEGWKKATTLDPANADLAVKVAFELARTGDPSAAIQVLKDSIEAAPKEPKSRVYLSQIYARHLKKPDLALQTAQKALEVAPDYFPAWIALYEMINASQPKKGAELLEKALKGTAKNAEYWLQLGSYLRRLYFKDDGTASAEEIKKLEVAYRKAIELAPHDAAALAQAGDYFILARDPKEAMELYQRALKLNAATQHPSLENLREKLARTLIALDRKAEAIAMLEQLAKDPEESPRSDVPELLGELYEQTGQMDKALEFYEQALMLDASEPRNHFALANMQIRAKRFDRAVLTLSSARKKFRDRPDITMALGLALSGAKKHEDALAMFAQAEKEAKGRFEQLLDAEFYFKYGATAEQAGVWEKAAELLKKCIALKPNEPEAYNYLGYMWADRNENLEEASVMIKKALEMSPDNGAYLDSLGWVYFRQGKYEDAKRELLRAMQHMPEEDAVVFEHMAETCEKLGDKTGAEDYWQRALKLDPKNEKYVGKAKTAAEK